jgi:dihydroorotase
MIPGEPRAVAVIDPGPAGQRSATLAPGPAGLTLAPGRGVGDDVYLSPGWVDLHAHVYDGFTSLSVPPDVAGLSRGVHLLADAGSAGEATIDGFARYLVPSARTGLRAWLNIGSHGLVHLREVSDLAWIDVDRTLAAIARHPGLICGVKVRSSGAIVGGAGLQPLELARLVAREAALPLMVHIGEAPPPVGDVLDRLDEGDVVTHCFHGKVGRPWRPDGSPSGPLRRALERGVRLDTGHGRASFSFEVAERAIGSGWLPGSISTDLHVRNIAGPVHDLATTMTKLLGCGMGLPDVVAAVTAHPRRVLACEEPWLGEGGLIRHATVFRVADGAPGRGPYADAGGLLRDFDRHVIPLAAIVNGRLLPCEPLDAAQSSRDQPRGSSFRPMTAPGRRGRGVSEQD